MTDVFAVTNGRGLTPAQYAARDGKLTASRVACLMSGDADKITNLWREMIGDPDYVPEDLSGVWAVQLGAHTESLNLEWFQRKTGRPLVRFGEVVVHPEHPWAAATLDAWDDARMCCVEAKHVGGREPLAKVVARYMPQMHWQMIVTKSSLVELSVIEGASEPVIEDVPFDAEYGAELWRRAEAFMECVRNLTPPVALAPVAAPIIPEKIYDMAGNNAWANDAGIWLTNREAKRLAEAAEKNLKTLVPADAKRCHGFGVEISRNRAGSLSLKVKS